MAKLLVSMMFCAFVSSMLVGETVTIHVVNRVSDYNYQHPVPTETYNEWLTDSAKVNNLESEIYQKYLICHPGTLQFEECTLCFCTDMKNLALCWDYDVNKCVRTKELVDEQNGVRNNDPNGVW